MSFFNSKPWAKIPTDLLENKAMIRTETELPAELRAAPVLLYLAGATKADDDGIFDIGDGEEFASLIKAASPETVRQVASAMVKFRIFAHVPDSTVYLFAEWEYTTRQNGKSLKNRFETAREIWKKKLEESSFFSLYKNSDTMTTEINNTPVKCSNTIQARVNECFNTIHAPENASSQIREDKRRENRQEQIKPEVEKITHTRVEGAEEEQQPKTSGLLQSPPVFGLENDSEKQQNQNTQENLMDIPDWTVVPDGANLDETPFAGDGERETGDAGSVPSDGGKNTGEVAAILSNFFSDNNVSYNVTKGLKTVEAIASEILLGAETPEMACNLAKRICFEFKKMHDEPEGGYWHNIPLFPVYMAKDAVWATLINRVSKIYGTAAAPGVTDIVEQAKKNYEECMKERIETGDQINAEYIRRGISPEDPHRVRKLLEAKAKET